MRAAYLDTSALVKLFKREEETDALVRALEAWPVWVSSEIVAVEARCTARRLGGTDVLDRAEDILAAIDLVGCAPEIQERAGRAFHRPLRALDAIHAATIFALGEELLEVVFVYDDDLRASVEAGGAKVAAPHLDPPGGGGLPGDRSPTGTSARERAGSDSGNQVLDAWAMLALLKRRLAAPRVKAAIDGGSAVASWINLGEVYHHQT